MFLLQTSMPLPYSLWSPPRCPPVPKAQALQVLRDLTAAASRPGPTSLAIDITYRTAFSPPPMGVGSVFSSLPSAAGRARLLMTQSKPPHFHALTRSHGDAHPVDGSEGAVAKFILEHLIGDRFIAAVAVQDDGDHSMFILPAQIVEIGARSDHQRKKQPGGEAIVIQAGAGCRARG